MTLENMREKVLELGASHAAVLDVGEIVFDTAFRDACARNACGKFGKSWMCPPNVGEINQLIAEAKSYKSALVFQLIGTLEDSYDFEGMMDCGQKMNDLTQQIHAVLHADFPDALYLGAGGCGLCDTCAIVTGEPCRFPENALASLESYGVSVSELATACGMRYINGANTVTYFGAVFVK